MLLFGIHNKVGAQWAYSLRKCAVVLALFLTFLNIFTNVLLITAFILHPVVEIVSLFKSALLWCKLRQST